MATFDGYVSLGEDRVLVALDVEEEKVTLSSNGREIGIWGPEDVSIRYLGRGRYEISAEDETLEFVPDDQDRFAIRFGEVHDGPAAAPGGREGRHSRNSQPTADHSIEAPIASAPPPRPVTRVAFYGLAVVTAALGAWAVVSLFIG